MKELSKTKQKEIKKLERASDIVHKLRVDLGKFLEKNNIPHDVLCDEFNSLLIGDISAEEFIEEINEQLDYYND